LEYEKQDTEWQHWWDARLAALEGVLGKAEGTVGHAVVPLFFGPENGGAADILYFRQHLEGVVATTASLIDLGEQVPSMLGAYELMICHRSDDPAGPELISRLAAYTLETAVEPGQTMSIGDAAPAGSKITALLFLEYARFSVRGKASGLLLCIGITEKELALCRKGELAEVIAMLMATGIYPFTDWHRGDMLPPTRPGLSNWFGLKRS
jgi:hypothetical protein